jgi:hypothetical protein
MRRRPIFASPTVREQIQRAFDFIAHDIDSGEGSEAADNGEDAIFVNWKHREIVMKQLSEILSALNKKKRKLKV